MTNRILPSLLIVPIVRIVGHDVVVDSGQGQSEI